MKFLITIIICFAPTLLHAQRVELRVAGTPAPATVSLFQYDTLYQVEAVALDSRGRKAVSAKPILDLHMWEVAKLVLNGKAKGNIVGAGRGTAIVVGSWVRSDGRTLTDTMFVNVPRARAMSTEICYGFADDITDAGTLRKCLGPPHAVAGDQFCVYVVARDRMGGYVTGVDPNLKSSDTTIVQLGSSPVCPDTTVNPYQLKYPLPVIR